MLAPTMEKPEPHNHEVSRDIGSQVDVETSRSIELKDGVRCEPMRRRKWEASGRKRRKKVPDTGRSTVR